MESWPDSKEPFQYIVNQGRVPRLFYFSLLILNFPKIRIPSDDCFLTCSIIECPLEHRRDFVDRWLSGQVGTAPTPKPIEDELRGVTTNICVLKIFPPE